MTDNSLQGTLQESIRSATGSTNSFEGDLHALADLHNVVNGSVDGRTITVAQNYDASIGTASGALNYLLQNPSIVTAPFILNKWTDAAAAYSTRKLRYLYAGSAIKVRRSSDNAEMDIGFVAGLLDEATLTKFAGAGDAFVTTWYDQSGNGRNAVQATAASQPPIVAAGVLIKEGSIPALNFDGTNHRLALSSGMGVLNNVGYAALFTVCRASAIDAVSRTAFWASTGAAAANPRFAMQQGVIANRFRFGGRRLDANSTQAINSNANHGAALRQVTAMAQYTDAAAYLYGNGALTASSLTFQTAGSSEATDSVLIGIGGSTVATWIGTISEMILYATDRTATRAAIEANQIAYFGVV